MQDSPSVKDSRWRGEERIIVGIDIGTTHIAVAYAYLYAGGPQVVKRVTSWPGLPAQRYESKIPSVVWYDRQGKPRSFCAEARTSATIAKAEQEGWYLAEQFKLHVHPPSMASDHVIKLIPLPPGVTVEQIYTDLLDYVHRHIQVFFDEKEFELEGGEEIWPKLATQNSIDFVLCHPSGWGLQEQSMLRRAVVKAGLVDSVPTAMEKVQFVGEAEASVHFVMFHADLQNRLQPGIDFVVCDAGGSTVDTTLYFVSSVTPLQLSEKRDSACIQAGGAFVDQSAKAYFQKKFYDGDISPDHVIEYVGTALQKFVTEVKQSFEDSSGDHLIAVADRQVTNQMLGISRGYMTLSGTDVEEFFKNWVDQIIKSIVDQIGNHPVKYILVVGGFGESPYLRMRLRTAPGLRRVKFTVPDQSGAKAASEGSVLWSLNKSVVARATRFAFGVSVIKPCDKSAAQLLGRPTIDRVDGTTIVHGGWSEIVPKGHVIEYDKEISCPYRRLYDTPTIPDEIVKDHVYTYNESKSTDGARPVWIKSPSGELLPGFEEVCIIETNLSSLSHNLKKQKDKNRRCFQKSKLCWALEYNIGFTFGSTELRAFLIWTDKGKTHRGPASIIPINRAVGNGRDDDLSI